MWEYRAKLVRVVDGDTIDFDLDLGFGLTRRTRIRLFGVNAPEITGEERERGRAAMKFVTRELVAATGPLIVRTHKADKYGGRWDGEVLYLKDESGEKDLSRELIAAGHAAPYLA